MTFSEFQELSRRLDSIDKRLEGIDTTLKEKSETITRHDEQLKQVATGRTWIMGVLGGIIAFLFKDHVWR